MNILITGGAGFIGSHLIEKLILSNHRIICMDNFDDFYDPEIKRRNISKLSTNSSFVLCQGDLRDKQFLLNCFKQNSFDLVIHLAARAGVRPSIQNPELYYDVNVNGTLYLLETMRQFNVTKMIFASSSSVYGNNKKIPFSETDNVDYPVSPYAASKKACELLCHTYYHLYGFDIFCLRFFTVYGPRQRPEMAIHYFTRNIMEQKLITLFGDGSSQRDYTYIDDIIDGIIKAINPLKGYEIINLGESNTISLSGLINTLENMLGKKAIIKQLPMQAGDVDITYADINKARRILGYHPSFPIQKGVQEFVNWAVSKYDFSPKDIIK